MASQGKDTALAYLKVVIHLLNENMEELELGFGRPMELNDLDHLTSPQMLRIVSFLLRDVVGEKAIFKSTALAEFNKFGIGNVTYDCGIDQIYHAVKSIFPDDCDLFHYSVLLLPSSNSKRTKAVISYIMCFFFMCDSLEERFSDCYKEVIQENEEKVAICNEIDDLKDKVFAKIQEKETEKERLPSMQNELQQLEENIRKQQKILAKLNEQVTKHKTIYESKEGETKNLEQQLERVELERVALEQQIVSNPNEIRADNANVKKQLATETKCRERIGTELEKMSSECDVFESLIKRAHHLIHGYESLIEQMENTKRQLENYMKTGNEMSASGRKIEIQKQKLQKLSEMHAEKLADVNKTKEKHEAKLEELKNEMLKRSGQISQANNQEKALLKNTNETYRSVHELSKEIESLKERIAACIHNIYVVFPKSRSEQEAEVVKMLAKIQASFNYPMPDISKLGKKN